MSAPEVVPVNSSAARVLWLPPQQPNGAVTGYHIYLNDHLHGSVDNTSGSYLLGNLLPFTVYNIQVHTYTIRHTHLTHKLQLCLFLTLSSFRWRCVLFTPVYGVMLPRRQLWRTCLLTWTRHTHRFSRPGDVTFSCENN